MRGEGGVAGCQPIGIAEHITWHWAQINFGDLTPYLTYAPSITPILLKRQRRLLTPAIFYLGHTKILRGTSIVMESIPLSTWRGETWISPTFLFEQCSLSWLDQPTIDEAHFTRMTDSKQICYIMTLLLKVHCLKNFKNIHIPDYTTL